MRIQPDDSISNHASSGYVSLACSFSFAPSVIRRMESIGYFPSNEAAQPERAAASMMAAANLVVTFAPNDFPGPGRRMSPRL
jgi:hypothetical protein